MGPGGGRPGANQHVRRGTATNGNRGHLPAPVEDSGGPGIENPQHGRRGGLICRIGMGGVVRIAWPLQGLVVPSGQAGWDVKQCLMKLAYVVLEIVESHSVVALITLIDDPSVPVGNCPRASSVDLAAFPLAQHRSRRSMASVWLGLPLRRCHARIELLATALLALRLDKVMLEESFEHLNQPL